MLHAEIYDSPLRWAVTSETEPAVVYLCDLAEWRCSCPHFECVVGPENHRTQSMQTCKHLRHAADRAGRFLLLREIVRSHEREGRLAEQA